MSPHDRAIRAIRPAKFLIAWAPSPDKVPRPVPDGRPANYEQ